jgi:hypothetical protein
MAITNGRKHKSELEEDFFGICVIVENTSKQLFVIAKLKHFVQKRNS